MSVRKRRLITPSVGKLTCLKRMLEQTTQDKGMSPAAWPLDRADRYDRPISAVVLYCWPVTFLLIKSAPLGGSHRHAFFSVEKVCGRLYSVHFSVKGKD